MTSTNTETTTESREGQDHAPRGPITLTPDFGVTAAADHGASLYLYDMRGTDQTIALVICACGWRRQSQHRRADVDAVDDLTRASWAKPWEAHVGRAVGLVVVDDRGIDCSRIMFGRYPGQQEILAAWQWAVSREGTPVTANARDGVAMDLAMAFATERDTARAQVIAATEHARGQLGITRTELDTLRTDADELRGDLAASQDDYKATAAQLTEARAALEIEREHRDCAAVADLEAQKDLTAAAWATYDAAAADARDLRTQRTWILWGAGTVAAVLVVLVVIGFAS